MKQSLFFKTLLILLAAYVLTAAGVALLFRHHAKTLPPMTDLEIYEPSLVTRLYDVHDELIAELFVERRSLLPLTEIPKDFQHAILAVEDTRFYDHWGLDLKGILRAFLSNLRAGRTVQGGSSITQQLAKNVFLTQDRTWTRKIKELLLTFQIEEHFSKDEILQLYINQIYFGHGAYGLEGAARVYFNKKAQDLTLTECALLAGLPRAPRRYSPFVNPSRSIFRRNIILSRMKEEGFIDEATCLGALGEKISTVGAPLKADFAPYFVEHIRRQLEPVYGSDKIYKGGLSVYTTLDIHMQRAAEAAVADHLTKLSADYAQDRMDLLLKEKRVTKAYYDAWKAWKEQPDKNPPPEGDEPKSLQAALVAIDSPTGGIRAMVGGRDFEESKFNRATQAKRQPGSTFKTFVWLTALESGWTAAHILDDYPLAFINTHSRPELVAEAVDYAALREMVTGYYTPDLKPDDPDPVWAPQNWDLKYMGPVTLRKGFAHSRNLVSVRLIDRVGPRNVVATAQRVGITSPLDAVLSLGLGTSVVTPLELTSAMGTFTNNGVSMTPYSIRRVVGPDGRVLQETIPQGQTALTPQTNYLMTRLLSAVVQEGTGSYAKRLGKNVIGKTGTTQDQRDIWFSGGVPGLAATVWIGHDDFHPIGKKVSSSRTSVPLWTDFMAQAVKHIPSADFTVPSGIVFAKIDEETGLLALPSTRNVVLEAFRSDEVPTLFTDPPEEDAFPLPWEEEAPPEE